MDFIYLMSYSNLLPHQENIDDDIDEWGIEEDEWS
jgi:hypothetical protein